MKPTPHELLLGAVDAALAGDWQAAHQGCQDLSHPLAWWLHAALHRQEGDLDNARWWYARAGRTLPRTAAGEEYAQIRAALLATKIC